MYQPMPVYAPNPAYYQSPYQQRLTTIEQTQSNIPMSTNVSPQPTNFLRGRPVTSMEEAKVAQIEFDGAINVFTDIANKRIYTKQINLDGTSSFNVYCQTAIEPEKPMKPSDYVTREEYNDLLSKFEKLVAVITQPHQQSISQSPPKKSDETIRKQSF